MPIKSVLVDIDHEYALVVRGVYGAHDTSVQRFHKSDQPVKQRAELLTLINDLLVWAVENNVVIVVASNGDVRVRDGAA